MAGKVLVVDDSAVIRRIHKHVLGQLGFPEDHVFEAGDAIEAVARLKSCGWQVDLILLDWNMPGIDGLTLLGKLRAVESLRSIPIVMVTTEAEKEHVRDALKAGASGYILKPFTADTLRERLHTILRLPTEPIGPSPSSTPGPRPE